jgi:hypothetical protein
MIMNRTLTSPVAAAAATAALVLIPLVLASSASAATTSATAYTPTTNWAGYVATMPAKFGMADQFGWIQADFTIPKTACSDSTKASWPFKTPKGQLYSAAAFWVGLGGVNGKLLEQDGIMALCGSKNSPAAFGAFYEMVPAAGTGSATGVTLYKNITSRGHGKSVVIHAGDRIVTDTWDYSTESEATGHTYQPGQEYRFQVTDLTQGNAQSIIPLQSFGTGVLGSDNTVEVVTEAINGGPWHGPKYTGIAHFQPVSYSGITLGLNGGGYTYGISSAESWTSALYYVHGGVGGLFGLSKWNHTLISTGGLSKGGRAFTNYWHKY